MQDNRKTKDQLIAEGQQKQDPQGDETMKDQKKTKEQLIEELAEMRQRVAELEAVETEHKRTEEQIRYQSLLVGNVSDAIFSTDINFNILFRNPTLIVFFFNPSNQLPIRRKNLNPVVLGFRHIHVALRIHFTAKSFLKRDAQRQHLSLFGEHLHDGNSGTIQIL